MIFAILGGPCFSYANDKNVRECEYMNGMYGSQYGTFNNMLNTCIEVDDHIVNRYAKLTKFDSYTYGEKVMCKRVIPSSNWE